MATKVEGLARLKAKLAALPGAAKAEMRAALEQGADEMVGMAQRLAPVDRGDLRESVEKIDGKHELQVIVQAGGPKAFYARWQEFGTQAQSAQPFFFPAYRALRRRIRGRITRSHRKAAQKVAAGGQ